MPHKMFEDPFFIPSDKSEVEKMKVTHRLPIPTTPELGKGAMLFPNPTEARQEAFFSGLAGSRNAPEASFGRLVKVRLHPNNPLLIGQGHVHLPEYDMIGQRLREHYESEDAQQEAENTMRELSRSGNNAYTPTNLTTEEVARFARAKKILTPAGRGNLVSEQLRRFAYGGIEEASQVADTLKLPYDSVGDIDSRRAVAKTPEVVQLKSAIPLR